MELILQLKFLILHISSQKYLKFVFDIPIVLDLLFNFKFLLVTISTLKFALIKLLANAKLVKFSPRIQIFIYFNFNNKN